MCQSMFEFQAEEEVEACAGASCVRIPSTFAAAAAHPSPHCTLPLNPPGHSLQSLSAIRLPLAAQKGSARWQAAHCSAVSLPGTPQSRHSHCGSSSALPASVLQGDGGVPWLGNYSSPDLFTLQSCKQ